MNRAGLVITLVIAVAVGVVFAVDPQLDLDISAPFFHAEPPTLFAVNAQLWVQATRWSARALIALLALPGFLAIIAKLILPHRRTLLEGRAALFAGVFMYLVVWAVHGFIYRWRATRISEDAIERALTRAGEAARRPIRAGPARGKTPQAAGSSAD